MEAILKRLVNNEEFTRDETHHIMIDITREQYSDAEIAAFIMGLQVRGITADELLGFRDGLLETGLSVDFSPYMPIDIVGTGGDGKNTFNISTCACFVLSGAGYKVAKHGNYAATSNSGASNVIENHGVRFSNDINILKCSLEESNMAYLHAPLFALGMKNVGPIRRAIHIPTFFNLLGPLVNPARPKYQMLGVANLQQMRLYNNALRKLNINYCIVNSTDGYDEISLTSNFKYMSNHDERILLPNDIGCPITHPEELYGGSTKMEASAIFDSVLENRATESQKNAVLANAALAIQLIESNKTLEECFSIGKESIESGKAFLSFKKFVQINS